MASGEAPRLPEIIDEAGDTPFWVPITGLVLLVLFVIAIGLSASGEQEGAAAEDPAAVEQPADPS